MKTSILTYVTTCLTASALLVIGGCSSPQRYEQFLDLGLAGTSATADRSGISSQTEDSSEVVARISPEKRNTQEAQESYKDTSQTRSDEESNVWQSENNRDEKSEEEDGSMFTTRTPLDEVVHDPAFEEFGSLLFPVNEGYLRGSTLGDIQLAWYSAIIEVYDGLSHGFGLGSGTQAEGWINHAVDFWIEAIESQDR